MIYEIKELYPCVVVNFMLVKSLTNQYKTPRIQALKSLLIFTIKYDIIFIQDRKGDKSYARTQKE